jgi:hypothetical protein
MPQRSLRIVQWISNTPSVGGCTACAKQFKAPMTAMGHTQKTLSSISNSSLICISARASRLGRRADCETRAFVRQTSQSIEQAIV